MLRFIWLIFAALLVAQSAQAVVTLTVTPATASPSILEGETAASTVVNVAVSGNTTEVGWFAFELDGWITSIDPPDGRLGPGRNVDVTINYTTAAIPAPFSENGGVAFVIYDQGSPQPSDGIAIDMTISAPLQGAIGVPVPALYQVSSVHPNDPATTYLPIWNEANNDETVNYVITPSTSSIQVSPASGAISTHYTVGYDVSTITFTGIAAELGPGNHTETLTVTDATASNTPQTVTMEIEITASTLTPVAVVTMSRDATNPCMAPCAVYFDGRDSTSPGLNQDDAQLDLDYSWDFKDASGTWSTGFQGNSAVPQARTVDYGPYTGHLFETAGDYAVELTVCNEDGCDTAIADTITVTDPANVIPAADTWCFSNDGDFTGCPANSNERTTTSFKDAIGGAMCDTTNHTARCLFKAGDTFYTNGTRGIGGIGYFGIITRFGDSGDPNPIVNSDDPYFINSLENYVGCGSACPSTTALMVRNSLTTVDWRIVDMEFQGGAEYRGRIYDGNGGQTDDLAFVRVKARQVFQVANQYRNPGTPIGSNGKMYFFDNDFADIRPGNGQTAIGIFDTDSMVFMGNTIGAMHTSTEHVLRMPFSYGAVLAHNDFLTGPHRANTLKIHNENHSVACAGHVWIGDNHIEAASRSGLDNGLNVLIGPNGNTKGNECVENIRIEGNYLDYSPVVAISSPNRFFDIGARNIAIRNNVCNIDDKNSMPGNVTHGCFNLASDISNNSVQVAVPHNARFTGNTAISSVLVPSSYLVSVGTGVNAVKAENNLCYLNGLGVMAVDCIIPGTGGTIQAGNVLATADPFATTPTTDPTTYEASVAGQADGTGVDVPFFTLDLRRATRLSPPDSGALEN